MRFEAKLKTARNENRLSILGTQGLFGFQFNAIFQQQFEKRYGDIGRDAIEERAMTDALTELIGAMNK